MLLSSKLVLFLNLQSIQVYSNPLISGFWVWVRVVIPDYFGLSGFGYGFGYEYPYLYPVTRKKLGISVCKKSSIIILKHLKEISIDTFKK